MVDKYIGDAAARMDQAVQHLKHTLKITRTGRASPALVEDLEVAYYGQPTPLKQIAAISVPDARTLAIQPWDKAALPDIEKAILKSDLGITPSHDGAMIHLPLPPLSEDRRRDLVKLVHRHCEDGRVAVRNVRRDAHEHLRGLVKQKHVSEDDVRRAEHKLQSITDAHIKNIDSLSTAKEREILQV
ncbi:MAG: ribosome recycling factor [Actinobacteria bacterium]|nr:ribosome recycling factor [Actinomycetota bacterium]